MLVRNLGVWLAAAALGLSIGAQAQAQIFGWVGGTEPYKPKPYEADASKMPLQMAGECYTLYAVAEDHRDKFYIEDERHKALKTAFYTRLDTGLKEAGQSASPGELTAPLARQMRQNWDTLAAYEPYDKCMVTADAGMVKLRATPEVWQAMACWAMRANDRPDDPKTLFLRTDITAAMRRLFDIGLVVRDKAFDRARNDAKAALAGPQADALRQKFAGCEASVRVPLRKLAFAQAPWGIVDEMWYHLEEVQYDLGDGLAGDPAQFTELDAVRWNTNKAAWDKWVASPQAADAVICAAVWPRRGGKTAPPPNGATYMDLAVMSLMDLGLSPAEAQRQAAIGAWAQDLGATVGYSDSCKAWGQAEAARRGKTFYIARF